MTQDGKRRTRKPLLVNLAWATVALMGLALGYVLSYAPLYRWSPFQLRSAYRPVDWLIDNTPLRRPLFWWADLFGVKTQFQHQYWYRVTTRNR